MRNLSILLLAVILLAFSCQSGKNNEAKTENAAPESNTVKTELGVYELRTYYASSGKLDDLLARFRNHTVALFEKHGMKNIAYWVPLDNDENVLIYLLGFQNTDKRKDSWNSFREDQDWIKAKEASVVNGVLVDSVRSILLKPTAFSPSLVITDDGPRVFEMRTYYTHDGKLDDLHARFRDHTMKIFENQGITNIVYFDLDDDQQGAENTLLYIISHASKEASEANWQEFLEDPQWISAYETSIRDGNLVDSLTSVYLKAADFSPLK